MSFRAQETSDQLYVSGTAKKHALGNAAHVDIKLLGAGGAVIAEKQDRINPTSLRPGGGKSYSDSYVARFPLSEARQATKILVVYHTGSH